VIAMPEMPQRRVRQDADATRDAFAIAGNQTINLGMPSLKESPTPGLLPRDVPGFTGREQELARITELAKTGSVAVAAVDGAAGIGKTTLVVHAAHRLLSASDDGRPLFPDGHLYADLRGCDITGQLPTDPGEVLEAFLDRLGVSRDEMPESVDERSTRLRDLLASKRALLVLDNAASESQVLPLLPGTGASLVLITSRSVLMGLEVDDRIDLDVLPDDQAVTLLTKLAGPSRAATEPEALADVVASCGGLPLALRIAGQLLVGHREWSIGQLAEMLADEQHRLDLLKAGDRQVRTAFEVSYRQLSAGDARMFRLLGLYPGPHFDKDIAGSLAGLRDPKTTELVLDHLAIAHLITEERAGRFRVHDLLRLFAREACAAHDDDVDRTAAGKRLATYFMNVAWYLDACLDPRRRPLAEADTAQAGGELLSQRSALAQFEAERANLVAIVRFAAKQGWDETVWRLSDYMGGALTLLRHLDDLLTVRQAALTAARNTGDTVASGRALGNLGNAYAEIRRFSDAINCFEDDLAISREIGDRKEESLALGNIGVVYGELSRFKEAIAYYEDALSICRKTGDRYGESQMLGNLGNAHQELSEFDDAINCYRGALQISWETKDRRIEGQIRNNLGIIYLKMGRFEEAIDLFEEDLAICRRFGDRPGEALTLGNLGNGNYALRQFESAILCYQNAVSICREVGDRHSEGRVLANLACAHRQLGQHKQAVYYWQDASKAMREAGSIEEASRYENIASAPASGRRWRRR
jgi:tetratricopeptide (TPR) repeat protein